MVAGNPWSGARKRFPFYSRNNSATRSTYSQKKQQVRKTPAELGKRLGKQALKAVTSIIKYYDGEAA